MDMNTKTLKKNAFRVTKKRGITSSRIRIPGISFEDMQNVNELLQPIIEGLDINQTTPGEGYSA